MWKSSTMSLPISQHQYYTTVQLLKKYKHGETVKLIKVTCQKGIYNIAHFDEKKWLKINLCADEEDATKTSFIHYLRLDGKPEELRLDKLQRVS